MFDALFSSLWWTVGSGIVVAALAAFFMFYLGRTLTRRLVYIGLGVVVMFTIIGYSKALVEQGRQQQARKTDKTINNVASQNRGKEQAVRAGIAGRNESLAVKKKRYRQTGADERDWIKSQEKPNGRIDPQTIELLER